MTTNTLMVLKFFQLFGIVLMSVFATAFIANEWGGFGRSAPIFILFTSIYCLAVSSFDMARLMNEQPDTKEG